MELLHSRLISDIETIASARDLKLVLPKYRMVAVNMCKICEKILSEEQIKCEVTFHRFEEITGLIYHCDDHIRDARLSMVYDLVDRLAYPVKSSVSFKTNHGDAHVCGIRLSKSKHEGQPVIFLSDPYGTLFYRSYSQILEMNPKEELEKLLDAEIPEDYPQELVEIFKTI